MNRFKEGNLSKKIVWIMILVAAAYLMFGEIGVGIVALFLMLTAA